MINLSPLPHKSKNSVYYPNFQGRTPKAPQLQRLPQIMFPTPKNRGIVDLPISRDVFAAAVTRSNVEKTNLDDILRKLMGMAPAALHAVTTPPPATFIVGNCRVTRLTDGKQIFKTYVDVAQNAEKSLLGKFFTFQNVKIDGNRWPTNGAENVEGHLEQLKLMDIVVAKKKNKPDFISQQILCAHKWYQDGYGKKTEFYNNMEMIRHLKENGVDVVPAPRPAQGGSIIDHDKFLIADGKRVLITGMNPSTHGPANHDFGWLIETVDESKPSEVDDFVQAFNASRKFSWYCLGVTKQINGPLNEEEQKLYMGLRKEIKASGIEYMRIVGDMFDNPNDLNRYAEGRVDLLPHKTLDPKDRKIHLRRTLSKEYKLVGEEPQETIREKLLDGFRTGKKIRGWSFVLTDNELVDTIIDRHKKGEVDAKFIVDGSIIKEFPTCRFAFEKLKEAGIARIYRGDKETGEKMHAKLLMIDDIIVSGSANTSERALTSNLGVGLRNDYPVHTQRINKEIMGYADEVKEFEQDINIPPIGENALDYKKLLRSKRVIGKLIAAVKKDVKIAFVHKGRRYKFTHEDASKLSRIHGYYGMMQERHNAKRKFKRGNSETSIAFESPNHVKLLDKQFEKDWKKSSAPHPELDQDREFPQPEFIDGKWQYPQVAAFKKGEQK